MGEKVFGHYGAVHVEIYTYVHQWERGAAPLNFEPVYLFVGNRFEKTVFIF
jgi:hypothetical protein